MRSKGSWFLAYWLLTCALLAVPPLWAQNQEALPIVPPIRFEPRPPAPPIHVASAAAAAAPVGFSPAQVRHAYGFDRVRNFGAGQTIAVVDAYDQPNIEADLAVFDEKLALPACTSANGCFRKIFSSGPPASNQLWDMEISLDVEWAHAIAPQAKIILVEAPSNAFSSLMQAVDLAVAQGASVVSMSWGTAEFSSETNYDNRFVVSGVTFVAAAGDNGDGVQYPGASPEVLSVGGTRLTLDAHGNYAAETAWNDSGGGISSSEFEPSFQAQYGLPHDSSSRRGVPDVAYNADPGTGYGIYDTAGFGGVTGWFEVGGTSAGTPQWAALIAIANSARVGLRKHNLGNPNAAIYAAAKARLARDFHSVTQGDNGACGALCDASSGYDYITGLGTPRAATLIPALIARP